MPELGVVRDAGRPCRPRQTCDTLNRLAVLRVGPAGYRPGLWRSGKPRFQYETAATMLSRPFSGTQSYGTDLRRQRSAGHFRRHHVQRRRRALRWSVPVRAVAKVELRRAVNRVNECRWTGGRIGDFSIGGADLGSRTLGRRRPCPGVRGRLRPLCGELRERTCEQRPSARWSRRRVAVRCGDWGDLRRRRCRCGYRRRRSAACAGGKKQSVSYSSLYDAAFRDCMAGPCPVDAHDQSGE